MNSDKKEPNYLLAIFIFIQLLFFIVIGFVFINIMSKNDRITKPEDRPKISINNLSSNDINLRDEFIDEISHNLLEAIKQNTSTLDLPKTNAIIRDDSLTLKQFNRQNFNALSFIVDIPNLEQSYQVYYKYPTDVTTEMLTGENPYAVLCLEDETQIIYPNFKCHSSYPKDIRQRIATDYIRFMEFDDFSITLDDNDPTQININPIIDVSDGINESYISQVKLSIQSLGISPDLFKYRIVKKTDLNYLNSY